MKTATGGTPGGGRQAAAGSRHASRLRNLVRALPVLAVVLMAILLYVVFIVLHAIPMLQLKVASELLDSPRRTRSIVELVFFHVFFVMFVVNYVLTLITPAGSIPCTPEWEAPAESAATVVDATPPPQSATARGRNPSPRQPPPLVEHKKTGAVRQCKWCRALKPDRAHHCRVCRQCVLRMDHHCPWVYNCIGWGNHKYFVLLVFYTSLTLLFAVGAMLESIKRAIDEPSVPFGVLFLLLFSETLATMLAFVSASFFIFHIWLTSRDMSTIEFCEKKFRRSQEVDIYDRGCCMNFKGALGRNPLLWLIPIDDREGDGLTFHSERGGAKGDIESAMPLLDAQPAAAAGGGENVQR